MVFWPIMNVSMIITMISQSGASAERVFEVLDTKSEVVEKPDALPLAAVDGRVSFEDVSFRYFGSGDPVLDNVSLTAEPGQVVALLGATGSGKSTIINLIPRFYDVTEGAILVDGIDIRQVRQSDLRDQIGFIPQKGLLFSGTIESNLLYADQGAGREKLEEAAEIAQAIEFIQEKPEGFQAEVAQGGANLSGGQKQRLAIARALVKKPPIYIFDDSFSALDFKTDSALRQALKQKTGDATVLIVTQRVATVRNADQIIVLEEGRVIGQGRHHELMEGCEPYREIAYSQLSKEELA